MSMLDNKVNFKMKKRLGILVLGLLCCNIGLAKMIVKLPKDTSSGFKKLHKSLTGKYYKDYGMQVVDKKEKKLG